MLTELRKPAMDAKGCLRTPRHSPEKYTTVCKYYGRFKRSTEMTNSALGGAKGSRANTSSGIRGGEDVNKATRTLWLVARCIYNRHAMSPFVKNPSKIDFSISFVTKSVNSRGHQLSTTNDTVFLCGPLRISATSALKLPLTQRTRRYAEEPYCLWLSRSTIRSKVLTAIPVGPFDR